jgi:VWFA-related protein
VALAVLAVFSAAGAQRGAFSETTSVVAVEVPVTVTVDGKPVTGLTAASFELYDGRSKQEIRDFALVDRRAAATTLPAAARRHFLILLDLAFTKPESVLAARQAARELVVRLHPTDLAAVATYTSIQGVTLLIGYTSDRDQLDLALSTLGVPDLVEARPDPLGLVLGRRRGGIRGIEQRVLDELRKVHAAERTLQSDPIGAFTGHFENLARLLAKVDGDKLIVFLSEGIPSAALAGENDFLPFRRLVNLRADRIGDADAMFGHTQEQDRLEDAIAAFRQAGCTIHTVDVSDLRTDVEIDDESAPRGTGEHSLVALAKDTGGRFFRSSLNLADAMKATLEATGVAYLLTYEPRDLDLDGSFHRLRVKLVNAPRGARVAHRAGFFAPGGEEPASAVERRLATAGILFGDEADTGLGLHVLTAAIPVRAGRAYVPVLLEIDGRLLLAGAPASRETLDLEIYGYATRPTGEIADFFVHALGRRLAEIRADLLAGGLRYWGHFDLPPGRYTARVMVRDRQSGSHALAHRAISVPAPESSEGVLLPPLFPESPERWVLARENDERRRHDVPYPFLAGGRPFIPAARPVVPSKGLTPFLLRSFNLAGGFTGEVTSPAGNPVPKVKLKWTSPEAAGDGHLVVAWLETRGLKPGEYTLTGRATGAAGEPHAASIRFVVE